MLINTVVLFLHDALPVFILLSLLASLEQALLTRGKLLAISLASGFLAALLIVNNATTISHLFDDAGMELLTSSISLIIYLLVTSLVLLLHLHSTSIQSLRIIVFGAILVATSLNGANFLVFLNGYWSQYGAARSLVLGIVLGLGISTSFSILLYFFVGWLRRVGIQYAHHILIVLFASGQLAKAVNLLSQVDVISSSPNFWDFSYLISDSSESGYVLASLFGYEASPSVIQVLVYITAILLPLLAVLIMKFRTIQTSSDNNGESQ